ncbi:DUF1565 domain-containing protein [Actinoplanes sp. TBRC 11911]|uniref:right-handed parallel beta-helix repeat-containing protein n=1 Tax=Actinoplanes sp. TBRC 11911 TaxID=2729386 RepID=UPI00145F7D5A|nr:right-handed parallel beta-helix repeat-containing protein [Actinoplanes sp. TBRC 11911]NMO56638.1 DUF1565 domain-containing protein [Actinoplanes sp. TBRC 11911]
MTAAHRLAGPRHAVPRRHPLIIAFVVLVILGAGGFELWRSVAHEGPPDVAAAGPGYWVSTHGSDRAAGTPASPWRTIQHAVALAPAGSKIFVRGGNYAPFQLDRAGLTVTSAPGERATIVGRSGTRNVVTVTAGGTTVANLTVQGCVPNPRANVDITGDEGSGIRIDQTGKVTVSGVTVRDSDGHNAAGLPVGCYGVLVTDSTDVHVTKSDVYHNGAGIVVSGGGGRGVLVDDNDVHDQNVIIWNSAAPDDDFGGYGLAATFVSESPGPVFRGNTVQRNHGESSDYGDDGGGMELYDASNITISQNTFEANDGVMETGTSGRSACGGTVFSDNKAIGTGPDFDTGLVLRCGTGMVISGNTFTNMAKFTFLLQTGGDFAGKIDGTRITGNEVTRRAGVAIWRLQYASAQPTGLAIEHNRYAGPATGFAILHGVSSEDTVTFDGWRAATGFDAGSSVSDP